MKNKSLHIILFLLPMMIACKKDYTDINSIMQCDSGNSLHPKNSEYQAWLNDISSKGIVGLTALIDKQGDPIWIGSAGYADIEQKIMMTPCHLHHTASIYKTYISVIVLQLVDEGKISVDDNISLYLSPDIINKLPNRNEITIRHLLEHRSGLPDIFEVDFMLGFFNNPSKLYKTNDLLEYVYGKDAKFKPGSDFYYSDANYALLSLIISLLEGDIVSSFNTRIKNPLNLTETYFLTASGSIPVGLACSYWDRYGDGKVENISDYQLNFTKGLEGTDGIITTANDMNTFLRALVDGSLISTQLFEQMISLNAVPASQQNNYGIVGYGMGIMHVKVGNYQWFGHTGNHIGSAAVALYCPQKQTSLVIFQNIGTFFSDYSKSFIFGEMIKDVETMVGN